MDVRVRGAETGGSHVLTGGGEMGALMRAHDWSATPLGPPESWPQSLKTLVGVMLGSNQPMFIAWGSGRTLIYNDAYSRILASKHPSAMGQDFLEVWTEIRADLVPIVEQAYAGKPVHMDDIKLMLNRRGYVEEAHFAFSYTPVRNDEGVLAGFFCPCVEVTEQVLAQRRREDDAERQRQLFEQAPGFITILNGPEHIFEFANAAYRRLFGDREYVGKSVREAFPDLGDQNFFELLDRVYTTGERFVAQHIPIRLKGTNGALDEHFLDFIYEPIKDQAAQPTGIFVEGHDVTDAHLAQLELRESEARLRALTDHLPSGMVYQIATGADGSERRFLYVSQSHEKLTGIPAANVVADASVAYELILPEDRERLADAEAEAMRTKSPLDVEARFRRADGEVRWCRILSAPREQADGSMMWDGIQIDTTDQKTAEAALRDINETLERQVGEALAERKLLADVFDATGAFIQVVDSDFNLIAINEANADEYERVYGLRPDVGDNLLDVLADHPEQRDAACAHFSRALAGETFTITGKFGDPELGARWYEIKFSPLRRDSGELIGAYHFSLDVTERRQEQERLQEAEEALRQSQKMETMGQLTGGVAHDFNNLLTPIVGSLDLLQRRGLGDERERRMIDGAVASAERARVLVQRLLAFSRRQPLRPTAVDVCTVTEGMAELVASTTGPQIKVVVDTRRDMPPATADQNQLEMALLNLSVNARDAMPDGGTLRISAQEEHIGAEHVSKLAPGHYIRLSVADTGTGMDEATLKRAVEPFFSTKGIGKGTGLGLSMVHGLAAQLGGALLISSTLGFGTNVELLLPVSQLPDDTSDRMDEAGPVAATGTVLLVDDEDLVRASAADMLADLGYAVIEAASANEALQLVEGGLAPDLLITDDLMPGMTGTELARELRQRRPSTPVLIVSGYAEVEGVAPDLPRLLKPFRRADLAASLASIAAVDG